MSCWASAAGSTRAYMPGTPQPCSTPYSPQFIRLRTFVPKIGTPLLKDIQEGRFDMLGPHGVLRETLQMVAALDTPSHLISDHYTNYINLEGRLPDDRDRLRATLQAALKRDESTFRPFFIGDQ